MWFYEKKLQYPAKVGRQILDAKYLITQYGGPDGEVAASLRYLLAVASCVRRLVTIQQISAPKTARRDHCYLGL